MLLTDIPTFPAPARLALADLGITTAEYFFEHAVRQPAAVAKVLGLAPDEVQRLARVAEGYLSPEFLRRAEGAGNNYRFGVVPPAPRFLTERVQAET